MVAQVPGGVAGRIDDPALPSGARDAFGCKPTTRPRPHLSQAQAPHEEAPLAAAAAWGLMRVPAQLRPTRETPLGLSLHDQLLLNPADV
jgi:hypothetical protein